MTQLITGTTIEDLHKDLDVLVDTSISGDVETTQVLIDLLAARLKRELNVESLEPEV